MPADYILAIDQGTTSSRAVIFNRAMEPITSAQQEFTQHFPSDGWVEHCAKEIWQSVLSTCRLAIQKANLEAADIGGIGITNQRETTVLWHRKTGEPLHHAIVWQDRRTAAICAKLKSEGKETLIQTKTGLLLDPYFSATKLQWLLDHTEGARALAQQGQLAFGTIDSWLLWQLTGGAEHSTDATNASRTLLFNIHTQAWDEELLTLFDIPASVLPTVKDNADQFGIAQPSLFGAAIPIAAMIGDQQAALVGQRCLTQGSAKCTFGTGAFMMANTGTIALMSTHRLLSTVAYRLQGQTTYAIEGAVFVAGAAIQWLRDGVHLIEHARDTEAYAEQLQTPGPTVFVPAFTGLGAPYWDPDARGALFGLTRDTGVADIVIATLQSIALQTEDLYRAMGRDGLKITTLHVDGGMTANVGFLKLLAGLLDVTVAKPENLEATAAGAAALAALQIGLLAQLPSRDSSAQPLALFEPNMEAMTRTAFLNTWQQAVSATRSFAANKR